MSIPVLAIVKNGKIEPVNPIDLPESTRLLLLLNPGAEALEWSSLALAGLAHAYGDDEPDYDLRVMGRLGIISRDRHQRLLSNLADYLRL